MKDSQPYIRITSWGNTQNTKGLFHRITSEELPTSLGKPTNFIVHGNGRSYGDCALNKHVLKLDRYDKIVSFDAKEGVIRCQGGILLKEILEQTIPEKWFLPVTPGTKYITVGGAIAADVHGKNHHVSGTFCDHLNWLSLMLEDGSIIKCSTTENAALFHATCGGMGLTGIILEAEFKLKPIESAFIDQRTLVADDLAGIFKIIEANGQSTYSVAWIDGFQNGPKLGKGVVFLGEHSQKEGLDFSFKQRIHIPTFFPSFLLNNVSMRIYNKRYFNTNGEGYKKVSVEKFFYPLDSIKNWNRIYGKKGFVQYQFVIPKTTALEGIKEVLMEVAKSRYRSFLTILKLLGKENKNHLSFPMEGYTLCMDFKMKRGLYSFLETLDTIVAKYDGRVYLAKDGRMSRDFFEQGYPKLEDFKRTRKKYGLERLQSFQSKRLGL